MATTGMSTNGGRSLLDQIQVAFENRDLGLLGPLLADGIRWGDDDHPRRCRNPADVLATFSRLMEAGVEGDIVQLARGSHGVFCELSVRWPEGMAGRNSLWQVYLLADDKIVEIRGYDDRQSAADAAGLPPPKRRP